MRNCIFLAFFVTTFVLSGCTLDKPPQDDEVAWRLNGIVDPHKTKMALTECGQYSLWSVEAIKKRTSDENKNVNAIIEQCMFKKGYRLNTGIFAPQFKGVCATDKNLPACQGNDVIVP